MVHPSPNETILVSQILAQVDLKKIDGDSIAWKEIERILQGANLSSTMMWRIFTAADLSFPDRDTMTRHDLAVVVRLIGWAQNDVPVSRPLVRKCTS